MPIEQGKIILQQIGGERALKLMLDAYNFAWSEDDRAMSFRFKGNARMNHLSIKLNGMDTYDLTFSKVPGIKGIAAGKEVKVVKEVKDIYADHLKATFEDVTQLFLSVPNITFAPVAKESQFDSGGEEENAIASTETDVEMIANHPIPFIRHQKHKGLSPHETWAHTALGQYAGAIAPYKERDRIITPEEVKEIYENGEAKELGKKDKLSTFAEPKFLAPCNAVMRKESARTYTQVFIIGNADNKTWYATYDKRPGCFSFNTYKIESEDPIKLAKLVYSVSDIIHDVIIPAIVGMAAQLESVEIDYREMIKPTLYLLMEKLFSITSSPNNDDPSIDPYQYIDTVTKGVEEVLKDLKELTDQSEQTTQLINKISNSLNL